MSGAISVEDATQPTIVIVFLAPRVGCSHHTNPRRDIMYATRQSRCTICLNMVDLTKTHIEQRFGMSIVAVCHADSACSRHIHQNHHGLQAWWVYSNNEEVRYEKCVA